MKPNQFQLLLGALACAMMAGCQWRSPVPPLPAAPATCTAEPLWQQSLNHTVATWAWRSPAVVRPVTATYEPLWQQSLNHYIYTPAETNFQAQTGLRFMAERSHWGAVIASCYLLFLAAIDSSLVATSATSSWRDAFRLRRAVHWPKVRTAWNLGLAVFSAVGVSRMLPTLLLAMRTRGVTGALCSSVHMGSGASGLWTLLFVLSKVAELGDTLLLLLHGKELSFLHVYHHSSVLVWSWHQYVQASAPCFAFAVLNYGIHSWMYLYFAVVEWRGPSNMRSEAAIITTAQTLQMLVGLAIVLHAGLVAHGGGAVISVCGQKSPSACQFSNVSQAYSFAMYLSYTVLFLQFADKAYALRIRALLLVRSVQQRCSSKGGSGAAGLSEADLARRPWLAPGLSEEKAFDAACSAVPLHMLHISPGEGLKLYGLYKQAHCGECINGSLAASQDAVAEGYVLGREGHFSTIASSGLDRAILKGFAWAAHSGLPAAECRSGYVATLDAIARRTVNAKPPPRPRATAAGAAQPETNFAKTGQLYAVSIRGIGRYLPERVVTTAEVEKRGNFAPGSLGQSRCGVKERRRASPDERACDMAAGAAREALAEAGLRPEELDLIINASGSQEQALPDGSVRIQHALGLQESGIECFSVHATCLSFLVGLDTAAAMLMRPDGRTKRVLVCSTEIVSHAVDPNDAHSAPLFGDGAAAVVLTRTPADLEGASAIEMYRLATFSSGMGLTYVEAGGSNVPPYPRDDTKDTSQMCPDFNYERCHFQMDGPATVRFVAERLPAVLEKMRPGLSHQLGDIDWVVPHQASGLALDTLSAYGWPQGRILRTIETLGNCLAASIPMTLYEGIRAGKIRRGQRVLLCGTGAGLSFGGLVLVY